MITVDVDSPKTESKLFPEINDKIEILKFRFKMILDYNIYLILKRHNCRINYYKNSYLFCFN